MENDRNIELIILHFLQQTISEDEMKVLMAWIKESAENKKLFFQLKNVHRFHKEGAFPTTGEVKESKERLFAKLNKAEEIEHKKQSVQAKRQRVIGLCKYAAVAILFIGLTLGFQKLFNKKQATQYTEMHVESGPRMSHLVLPDGTKVVLNASSRFKFSDSFEKNIREVYLDGEAFFDVTKNDKAPFVIHTSKQNISVLGTTFNVMDYSSDDHAITTLVSGKISMQAITQSGELGEEVILKPSQQVFFNQQTNQLTLSSIPINTEKTWVNKAYHFREETLSQISQRLEKIYGVKIEIANEALKEIRCTGTFRLDQEIEAVIKIINFDNQFTYTITEDKITIQ